MARFTGKKATKLAGGIVGLIGELVDDQETKEQLGSISELLLLIGNELPDRDLKKPSQAVNIEQPIPTTWFAIADQLAMLVGYQKNLRPIFFEFVKNRPEFKDNPRVQNWIEKESKGIPSKSLNYSK